MKVGTQLSAWLSSAWPAGYTEASPKAARADSARDGAKRLLLSILEWFGGIGEFCAQVARAAVTPPYEGRELLRQMDEIGSKSLRWRRSAR